MINPLFEKEVDVIILRVYNWDITKSFNTNHAYMYIS